MHHKELAKIFYPKIIEENKNQTKQNKTKQNKTKQNKITKQNNKIKTKQQNKNPRSARKWHLYSTGNLHTKFGDYVIHMCSCITF